MYQDIIKKHLDEESTNKVIQYVEKMIEDNHLDRDKAYAIIEEKLTDTDLTGIKNFKKWIKVVITNIFLERKHEMIINHVSVNLIQLFIKLEDKGFTLDGKNEFYLELIVNHAINEFPVKQSELSELFHQITSYIIQKDMEKTLNKFIQLVLRSKLFQKVSIPRELAAQAEKLDKTWNNLIKELEDNAPNETTVEDALEREGGLEDVGSNTPDP